MNAPKWVERMLGPFLQATPGGTFLAVEGQDDQDVYGRCLERLAVAAGKNPAVVQVEVAGNKSAVIKGLGWLASADGAAWVQDFGGDPTRIFGVVDRDEWNSATSAEHRRRLPQLRVNLQRHCLESYFCDPEEIGASLLARDANLYRQPWETLRTGIHGCRNDWLPHWALWVTLQRAFHRLALDESFPHAFYNQRPLPQDGEIKRQLRTWSSVLNARELFKAFEAERAAALNRRHATQLRSCVLGKEFFAQVVLPLLQQCDHTVPAEDWKLRLVEWAPALPNDLVNLLSDIVP